MKKILIIGLIGLILITGCSCKKKSKESPKTVDTSNQIIESQKQGDFTFSPLTVIFENGMTVLSTNITNNSEIAKNITSIKIILLDEKDKEIIELSVYVGKTLESGQKEFLSTSATLEYKNVKNIQYIIEENQ